MQACALSLSLSLARARALSLSLLLLSHLVELRDQRPLPPALVLALRIRYHLVPIPHTARARNLHVVRRLQQTFLAIAVPPFTVRRALCCHPATPKAFHTVGLMVTVERRVPKIKKF